MRRLILLIVLLCSACQQNRLSPTQFPTSSSRDHIPTAIARTPLPLASKRPEVTASRTSTIGRSTPTLASSSIFESYEQYTIDFLRKQTYGGGKIEIVETLEDTDSFIRYLIRYPSNGLNIYGFVNVPKGDGPFPVIIAIHGFVDVANYQTLDYSTPAADGITQAGYIVFHPNLRGYPPSDNGDNLFRVGMAVDVLNLMALIKSESGPSKLFVTAAPQVIGLWGHSMGGDVVLRVLTVSSDIQAAVLYASLTGDEGRNAQVLMNASSDPMFQTEITTPPAILERISPLYYYKDISAPIQLHHGTADETVSVVWAQETCDTLKVAGVQIDCLYYQDEGHTFRSRVINQFGEAVIGFYKKYLSP